MEQVKSMPTERRVDVGEIGGLYLHHLEHVMRRKPSTVQDYRIMLRRHFIPYFGRSPISGITVARVSGYMTEKLGQDLSPKTVNNHLNFLHGVFAFAVKRDLAASNPVSGVDRPRPDGPNPDIRFLDRGELEALMQGARDERFGPTDRAVFLTAATAGLRQGELLALRWQDVDFKAGVIRVRRNFTRGQWGTPKSRRASRAVPMGNRLAHQLRGHSLNSAFSGDSELVFPHPELGTVLDASRLRLRFKTALACMGLPDLRFHDLRHTYGTLMAGVGTPLRMLQEWMGHRDYKTTLIYADYAPNPAGAARFTAAAFGVGEEGRAA